MADSPDVATLFEMKHKNMAGRIKTSLEESFDENNVGTELFVAMSHYTQIKSCYSMHANNV